MWFVIIFSIIAGFAYGALKGAPWVPTSKSDIDYIFSKITLPKNAVIFDLGSGDGRVIFQAAQKINVSQAVGVELAWPLYIWSVLKTKLLLSKDIKPKIKFLLGDFFKTDIQTADLVFCFLMPETVNKLAPQIISKMKPGALLVSAVFEVKSLKSLDIIKPAEYSCTYYVYQV